MNTRRHRIRPALLAFNLAAGLGIVLATPAATQDATIENQLNATVANLVKAERSVEIGVIVLTDAITARSDALAAGAPDHSPDEWKDAKKSMYEAGRSVEKGDSNDARKKASKAESKFRKSELTAIRVDLLGAARQAREAAQEADAEEKAPRTDAEGVQALAAAESTLKGDRYQRAEAKDHAKTATAAFQHATYIAGMVDRVEADNPEEFEKLQRQHDMSELQNLFDSDQASVIRQGDASTR